MGLMLDVGCGANKQPGTIGVDRRLLPGVDVVCDFEYRLPFRDASVWAVYSTHSIEHIRDLMLFMEEMYRICAPGAKVYVRTPYYMSRNAFVDPTHVRFMTEKTFEYFSFPNCYGLRIHFRVVSIEYKMRKLFKFFPSFLQHPFRRHLWNVCDELVITLEAVKPCGD
jgi:predicted SAM-dependent methyltransferase